MARKKRNYKGRDFTPQKLADYLMNKKLHYCALSARQIKKACPELGIGVEKINKLKKDPEFNKTVHENFLRNITDDGTLNQMFWMYLYRWYENSMKNPVSSKPIDVLGYLSKQFMPKQHGDTNVTVVNPEQQKTVDEFLSGIIKKHSRLNN